MSMSADRSKVVTRLVTTRRSTLCFRNVPPSKRGSHTSRGLLYEVVQIALYLVTNQTNSHFQIGMMHRNEDRRVL